MIGTLWLVFWTCLGALGVVGAVRFRMRLRALVHRPPVLEDDDVRDIIAHGVFVSDEDEPLDLDQVNEEERRFWEEAQWDEAEEW